MGSGPQDLAQFMISHMVPAERRACERQLLHEYADSLVAAAPAPAAAAAYEAVAREYAAGGAERWVWLLALLAGLCPLDMLAFWAAQLDAFCEDWGITTETVGMPRV